MVVSYLVLNRMMMLIGADVQSSDRLKIKTRQGYLDI